MFGPQTAETQIEGLIEIVPPQPVSYGPETIGWYILFGLIVLSVTWFMYRRYRYRKTNKYRRWALAELEELLQRMEKDKYLERGLSEIPVLVKRTAMHYFPRDKVASLSGEKWLKFLDASYGGTGFAQGPGQMLEEVAYQPAHMFGQYTEDNIQQLINLVRTWIKKHRSDI